MRGIDAEKLSAIAKLARDLREGRISEEEYLNTAARLRGYPDDAAYKKAVAEKHRFPSWDAYQDFLKKQKKIREETERKTREFRARQPTRGFFKK